VTAEIAVALPSLVLISVVVLTAFLGLSVQGRCADVARFVARASARGDDPVRLREAALSALPPGSAITAVTSPSEGTTRITVSSPLPTPPVLSALLPPGVRVSAAASAADEGVSP
jgi:hypothetical protein